MGGSSPPFPARERQRCTHVVWQVLAANKIYMTARRHAVFFSRAEYPVYNAAGTVAGKRDCDPWDRCWSNPERERER